MTALWRPRSVLIDSGASLAIVNRNDEHHRDALAIQRDLFRVRPRLLLTTFLVDETYTLLLTRVAYQAAVQFLDAVESDTMTVIPVTSFDEAQARQILRLHAG